MTRSRPSRCPVRHPACADLTAPPHRAVLTRAGQVDCHKVVTQREAKFTNFVEWRTHKLVYRRYAGLFFTLCVDVNDNELGCLEAIHLFVEVRPRAQDCLVVAQRCNAC